MGRRVNALLGLQLTRHHKRTNRPRCLSNPSTGMMSRRELPSHLQSDTDQGIKRLFLFRNLFFLGESSLTKVRTKEDISLFANSFWSVVDWWWCRREAAEWLCLLATTTLRFYTLCLLRWGTHYDLATAGNDTRGGVLKVLPRKPDQAWAAPLSVASREKAELSAPQPSTTGPPQHSRLLHRGVRSTAQSLYYYRARARAKKKKIK